MTITLIRHTSVNVPSGICYGQSDIDVSDNFKSEAPIVKDKLASNNYDAVYSSPLQRCEKLAHYCGFENPTIDARLMEINFGNWEMQAWDAIGPTALDAWAANIAGFRPPGGETGHELQQRVLAWLREISDRHHHAIVVTHAGVIRALQAHHQRLSGTNWLKLRYDYGELLYLDFTLEQIQAAPVQ
jgi:alpha-ribazole phosphatase